MTGSSPPPPLSSPPPPSADSRVIRLQRLRRLGRALDSAIGIPGTKVRLGLDPIIGLIPGGGDTAGLVLSSFIVLEAARMGASKSVLSAMVFNILLETLAGTVPVVGDIFDVTWKSNLRNIALLEEDLQLPHPPRRSNHGFAILLIGGLVLAFAGCLVVSFLLLRWLIQVAQSTEIFT